MSGVDLAQWLGAQLDEDERIARAACWDDQSDVWTARPPRASYERYTVVDYLDDGVVVVTPENADADGVGKHIAEHDPARVLREVEAKRSLVAAHECVPMSKGDTADCAQCWGAVWPCPTLRLLAAVYDDRNGYQEAWRP